ncbi:MAG TPA: hypothetical protein VI815_01795 [Candidatus Nanoarchaeia archaeon]|nr:hypothetical protein [Candidatus Nanoarchaeia archaeon]
MLIKNILIGLAITILASFVAIYGILAFYGEAPQWDDYCGNITQVYEINTSQECDAAGGKWNPTYNDGRSPVPKTIPNGYCDLYYQCNMNLEEAQKSYSKTLFLITVPVGVILIIVGAALFGLEAVGAGIMLAGIVTLVYGAGSYWPNANNMFRFLISLAGLVLVIILAYWINKKVQEKQKKGFLKNLFKKKRR